MKEQDQAGKLTDNERVTVLLGEYGLIVKRQNSREGWAYSFVALYFAFMASIGSALGFLLFELDKRQGAHTPGLDLVFNFEAGMWLFALNLAAIGLVLNIWAIYMLVAQRRIEKTLLDRMIEIECSFDRDMCLPMGFAKRTRSIQGVFFGKVPTGLVVAPLMVLFFIPWLLAILVLIF